MAKWFCKSPRHWALTELGTLCSTGPYWSPELSPNPVSARLSFFRAAVSQYPLKHLEWKAFHWKQSWISQRSCQTWHEIPEFLRSHAGQNGRHGQGLHRNTFRSSALTPTLSSACNAFHLSGFEKFLFLYIQLTSRLPSLACWTPVPAYYSTGWWAPES